jgi:hypothetical protein
VDQVQVNDTVFAAASNSLNALNSTGKTTLMNALARRIDLVRMTVAGERRCGAVA